MLLAQLLKVLHYQQGNLAHRTSDDPKAPDSLWINTLVIIQLIADMFGVLYVQLKCIVNQKNEGLRQYLHYYLILRPCDNILSTLYTMILVHIIIHDIFWRWHKLITNHIHHLPRLRKLKGYEGLIFGPGPLSWLFHPWLLIYITLANNQKICNICKFLITVSSKLLHRQCY